MRIKRHHVAIAAALTATGALVALSLGSRIPPSDNPITTDLRAGPADIYLDHFPKELVEGTHDSLMQVR